MNSPEFCPKPDTAEINTEDLINEARLALTLLISQFIERGLSPEEITQLLQELSLRHGSTQLLRAE